MPELDCFITSNEFACLLEDAYDGGFRLLSNQSAAHGEHGHLRTRRSIRELLRANQNAFILERDDFTRHRIRLRPIVRDGVTVWYPRAKEGGPAIEAYFFAPHLKDGVQLVPCSLLAYGSKIIDPATGLEEPAGDAVKKAFETLTAPIRKEFRRVKSIKRSAYVSPGIDTLIEGGWKLAPPFDG